MRLAEQLGAAVTALRQGRAADAVEGLKAAWTDPALAEAEDLRDLRARVGSLFAQALLETGRVAEADRVCRDAVRLLRQLRDTEGLTEVRALQERIVRALAELSNVEKNREEAARVAATPLAMLLFTATTPEDQARVRVQKASALWTSGHGEEARALAEEALSRAEAIPSISWVVFARTLLAEIHAEAQPSVAQAHLATALTRAAQAQEFNLVSTIAQTAAQLGISLPQEAGPHAGLVTP
ncbi:MAG: hypothetical protein RLZZ383_1733 [Pseudomonadota bacterium]|jgi:hypothetical protein